MHFPLVQAVILTSLRPTSQTSVSGHGHFHPDISSSVGTIILKLTLYSLTVNLSTTVTATRFEPRPPEGKKVTEPGSSDSLDRLQRLLELSEGQPLDDELTEVKHFYSPDTNIVTSQQIYYIGLVLSCVNKN